MPVSTYEANWETGVLVTAEAVFGIGFSPQAGLGIGPEVPVASLMQERPQAEIVADEAAD